PELAAAYDAVISNPPYGLRLSYNFRRDLKARLGRFYVRESYALFLRFSIERLKRGGLYVFLIPDTFLTSHNHQPLREFLLREAPPTNLILFASKRFGSVQFGYGSMCVIAGTRCSNQQQPVRWLDLRHDNNMPLDDQSNQCQATPIESLKETV